MLIASEPIREAFGALIGDIAAQTGPFAGLIPAEAETALATVQTATRLERAQVANILISRFYPQIFGASPPSPPEVQILNLFNMAIQQQVPMIGATPSFRFRQAQFRDAVAEAFGDWTPLGAAADARMAFILEGPAEVPPVAVAITGDFRTVGTMAAKVDVLRSDLVTTASVDLPRLFLDARPLVVHQESDPLDYARRMARYARPVVETLCRTLHRQIN